MPEPTAALFRALFDSHPHPQWIVDRESYVVLLANPAAGQAFGCAAGELMGKRIRDLQSPDGEKSRGDGHGRSEDRVTQGGVWRFQRHDGSEFMGEITSAELTWDGRQARLVVARDVTEREASHRDLREREARQSTAVENVPECVVTADGEGRILEFNAAAERVFGYARADVVGREIADVLVPAESRERHRRGLAHYSATGERHIIGRPVEMRALRADGSTVWVEILVSAVVLDGQTMFAAHIRDLTEAKRSERQISTFYAICQILAEGAGMAHTARETLRVVCEIGDWDIGLVWNVDRGTELLRLSEVWRGRRLPMEPFEQKSRELSFRRGIGLPGRVWQKGAAHWVPDISSDPNFPRASVALACGLRSGFAFPIRAGAGVGGEVLGVVEFFSHELRTFEREMQDTFSAVGLLLGQYSEHRRQEDRLRETNEMLQALLTASPLAIIQLDRDLTVRFWNAAAERMFGWTAREILGRPYPVMVPAEKRAEFKRLCDELLKGGELRGIETWRKRKDGSRVNIYLSAVPLRSDAGEITGLLGVVAEMRLPPPPGPRL